MERKLASIKRVEEIIPIEEADAIELVRFGGWQCVSKLGEFKVGDLALYCEIDAHLPIDPRYEFLRKNCFKILEGGREGFRIKSMKLRGCLSQGLALPLTSFPEIVDAQEDMDVTELLNIAKYEKPLPAQLSGMARGNFPTFLIKTDAERIQNLGKLFHKIPEEPLEATLKLDGSSCTIYNHEGVQGVCSRNIDLKEEEGNSFWRIARKYKLPELLPEGFAIQGELMGPGIQGNREGLQDLEFFLFDVYDINKREYLSPEERENFHGNLYNSVYTATGHFFKKVPILHTELFLKDFTMDSLLKFADGPSLNHTVREGIVFRTHNKVNGEMIKFKAISNQFLLKEKD
jgi:RNA ligase (TIGR02306 family)